MTDSSEGAALCLWPGAVPLIAASYQLTATEGSWGGAALCSPPASLALFWGASDPEARVHGSEPDTFRC